jgi:hypothetical protein
MAAVVFAFGAKPALSEQDAFALAELLEKRRSLTGASVAAKIRTQARVDVSGGQVSQDIELEGVELDTLAYALAEEPWAREQEWFPHMRGEVAEAQARSVER